MSDEQVEASVYQSNGKHKDELIEQVKADTSINPTNAHWEEPESYQDADVVLVPDDGMSLDDIVFGDQTPLWHTHDLMVSTVVGQENDMINDKGAIYFKKWET